MKRIVLLVLFPLRYYAYLTAPLSNRPPAALVLVEREAADTLSA